MPLSLSEDLAEEVRKAEEMTGGGASAALKALKVRREALAIGLTTSGRYCSTALTRLSRARTRISYWTFRASSKQ
jgi:hypothetical protein